MNNYTMYKRYKELSNEFTIKDYILLGLMMFVIGWLVVLMV